MRLELVHPMIVHFPIVLVITLLAFDAYAVFRRWRLTDRSPAGNASVTLAVAAGVFAILAYFFGDEAYDVAMSASTPPSGLLETHADIGSVTTALIALWAVFRLYAWMRNRTAGSRAQFSGLAVESVLVAMVLLTAYYGGELVYGHGVAVALVPGAS